MKTKLPGAPNKNIICKRIRASEKASISQKDIETASSICYLTPISKRLVTHVKKLDSRFRPKKCKQITKSEPEVVFFRNGNQWTCQFYFLTGGLCRYKIGCSLVLFNNINQLDSSFFSRTFVGHLGICFHCFLLKTM